MFCLILIHFKSSYLLSFKLRLFSMLSISLHAVFISVVRFVIDSEWDCCNFTEWKLKEQWGSRERDCCGTIKWNVVIFSISVEIGWQMMQNMLLYT